MKLLARILALFILLPILELYLLIQLEGMADGFTDGHGLLFTLALIVVTGTVGSYLAKKEGLHVWRRLKRRVEGGQMPGKELLDGVIILVAGGLLITPGIISDILGLMGLIPATRALMRKLAMRRLKRAVKNQTLTFGFGPLGGISYPSSESSRSSSDPVGSSPGSYGEPASPESKTEWGGEPKQRPGYRQKSAPNQQAENESDDSDETTTPGRH